MIGQINALMLVANILASHAEVTFLFLFLSTGFGYLSLKPSAAVLHRNRSPVPYAPFIKPPEFL